MTLDEAWATSVAAGIPDDLYWRSNVPELDMLHEQIAKRRKADERAATLRAGLIAATVHNMAGKRATRTMRARDFLPTPVVDAGPDGVKNALLQWATDHNKAIKA